MVKRGKCINIFEENKKNLNFLEVDMFSRAAALQDEADLAMIFYSNTGAAKYGYHLLKIFDENIAYPQVVAVRDEDKDSQWVHRTSLCPVP